MIIAAAVCAAAMVTYGGVVRILDRVRHEFGSSKSKSLPEVEDPWLDIRIDLETRRDASLTLVPYERTIKLLGLISFIPALLLPCVVYYTAAAIDWLDEIGMSAPAFVPGFIGARLTRPYCGGMALVCLIASARSVTLAFGLRGLRPWARWSPCTYLDGIIAISLLFVVTRYGTLKGLGAVILVSSAFLLWSYPYPIVTVFSPRYRTIARKTPHLDIRTGVAAKIVLVTFAVFVLAVIYTAIIKPHERMKPATGGMLPGSRTIRSRRDWPPDAAEFGRLTIDRSWSNGSRMVRSSHVEPL